MLALANCHLSRRDFKVFFGIAGGTFLTGLLLSCLIFPLDRDSLVDLKTTLPVEVSPQVDSLSVESPMPQAGQDIAPVPPANPEVDLISLLNTDGPKVRHETKQVKESWQTVRMRVTGYCACSKCCGTYDGITANNHRIVKGDAFVAADKFYGFGTEMVIPGYNAGRAVPVMDRGKAIKGNCLDLFFHSHTQAKKWGVKYLDVQVKVN